VPAHGWTARGMTASRRLAAIMAVDVVGHSLLIGEHEAGTAWECWATRTVYRPVMFNP
jgi:hypothetical protein